MAYKDKDPIVSQDWDYGKNLVNNTQRDQSFGVPKTNNDSYLVSQGGRPLRPMNQQTMRSLYSQKEREQDNYSIVSYAKVEKYPNG